MKARFAANLIAVALGFIFLPPAIGQDMINRREQARAAFLANAPGIYRHYCAHCHGEDGQGEGRLWSTDLSPKPTDLTALKADQDNLIKMIRDGSAAQGKSNLCPPWGRTIAPLQLERLAQYILTLSGQSSAPAATPSPAQKDFGEPFPWLLAGVILLEIGVLGAMMARKRKSPNGEEVTRI